ncbi:hypothetical protein Ancab_013253, partial [Ancistrocladus abbreviatus]
GEDAEIVDRIKRFWKLIKTNLIAAASGGKDLEGAFFPVDEIVLWSFPSMVLPCWGWCHGLVDDLLKLNAFFGLNHPDFYVLNLSETGSEDDGHLDLSDDDFSLDGSSSDESDADDELTDKSTKYDLQLGEISVRLHGNGISVLIASIMVKLKTETKMVVGVPCCLEYAKQFKEHASSASGIYGDEWDQRLISAQALIPPPMPSTLPLEVC